MRKEYDLKNIKVKRLGVLPALKEGKGNTEKHAKVRIKSPIISQRPRESSLECSMAEDIQNRFAQIL